MSRKANNLRKRLRISNERARRFAKLASTVSELQLQLANERKQALDEDRQFVRSVMLAVEQDRYPFDEWAVRLAFRPDAYVVRSLRSARQPANLSECAYRVGHRIGEMATRAIEDAIERSHSPYPVRPARF